MAEAIVYASHLINRLSSTAIGGKTPLQVWSEKFAQDSDLLWVLGSPTYFSTKDGKVNPRARSLYFLVPKDIQKARSYGTKQEDCIEQAYHI